MANIARRDGKMKTITLQVEDVDQVIVDELKDAYQRNNKFDRVDCSDTVLEPDCELLKAIQTVLEYYMTAEEIELWNNKEMKSGKAEVSSPFTDSNEGV